MKFDYKKLNGKIVEVFSTQYNFAKAMDMSEHSLSNKLNNKVGWKTSEIAKASMLLHLSQKEIGTYFFSELSSNKD